MPEAPTADAPGPERAEVSDDLPPPAAAEEQEVDDRGPEREEDAPAGAGRWLADWFGRAVTVGLLLFVALGLVGLAAAIAGVARPALVLPLGLAVGVAMVVAWDPRSVPRPAAPVRPWVVVAALLVIGGSTAWNAQYNSQHIVTDRDQGIYVNGAKWLAEEGTLLVEGRGPGLEGVGGLRTNALGQQVPQGRDDTDPAEDGQLEIQSAHLLHTVMAEAQWVGGDRGLFLAPVAIGGVGLAAFFLFGLRLLPGPLALAATAALSANFAWLYVTRDALSEPLLLTTTFGGAWMATAALADGDRRRLVLAGVVLGTGMAARLDAGIGLGLVLVVVGLLGARRAAARQRARREGRSAPDGGSVGIGTLALLGAGFALPTAIAVADTTLRNSYYLSHHEGTVVPLLAFLAAATVLAAGLVLAELLWSRVEGRGLGTKLRGAARAGRRWLPAVAAGAAVAAVAVAAFAWFVRPEIETARAARPPGGQSVMANIQEYEGNPVDPDRTYAEGTVRRIAWYTGGPAVALGIAGMAVVAHRIVRGRATDIELVLVAVAVPATVLFVWKPSIYNDQPWMMRRFVPHVIPGLLLFAGVAASAAGAALARWRPATRWASVGPAVVTAVVAAVLVVGPLPTTLPVREAAISPGGLDAIERFCDTVGDDAVVVLANDASVSITLLPAVRSFCGVPAVRPIDVLETEPLPLHVLLPEVEEAGRTLWVAGHDPELLEELAPTIEDLQLVPLIEAEHLIPTISSPPTDFAEVRTALWVGRVSEVP